MFLNRKLSTNGYSLRSLTNNTWDNVNAKCINYKARIVNVLQIERVAYIRKLQEGALELKLLLGFLATRIA